MYQTVSRWALTMSTSERLCAIITTPMIDRPIATS